jgi:hypothetical protein
LTKRLCVQVSSAAAQSAWLYLIGATK